MAWFTVHHNTDNGGDFHWLHSRHVIEAENEDEAKKKSLALVDEVHQYTDVTRPRFITGVGPATAAEIAVAQAAPAVTRDAAEKEGE